jgi:TrmH family RNA methyltransferase
LYTTQHDFEEVALSKKTIIQESDLKKISALATPNNAWEFLRLRRINYNNWFNPARYYS